MENFHLSFKSLAGYAADLFNFSKIAQDLGIRRESIYRYFELLEKTLVLQTVPPFTFQELKNTFKSRKLFLFDCGVINRLRGFVSIDEIKRAGLLGKLFESFIFQNIYARVLNDWKKPALYYFRDYQNHEIDLIYQRGEVTIPIEITSERVVSSTKLKNYNRFFKLHPRSKNGVIFYTGEVRLFEAASRKIFALPYFLV